MLISLCIPCMNRLDDLRVTLPYALAAARESPPVQVSVLDYSSTDGLPEYMAGVMVKTDLMQGNFLSYKRIEGQRYWHMAKGYNLSVLQGQGEYVVHMGADAIVKPGYLPAVRAMIADGCVWGRADKLRGIIFFQREEFVAAGGFDERIELYGPDDRDLEHRLFLRGGKFGLVPPGLLEIIRTPDAKKVANYRVKGDKHSMSKAMHVIFDQNVRDSVTVANQGIAWGVEP